MKSARLRLAPRLLGTLLCSLVLGCAESGQTGSPFGERPEYKSPGSYTPSGDTGGTDGGATDPGSHPSYSGEDQEPGGFVLGYWVTMSEKGLSVFDVSGSSPKEVSYSPLRGDLRSMVFEGTRVYLAIHEDLNQIDADEVPQQWGPAQKERLVVFDLSDPQKPVRIASADLEGESWKIEVRGDSIFVLGQIWNEETNRCGYDYFGRGLAGMKVVQLQLLSNELERVEEVSVDLRTTYAYYSDDGYFFYDEVGADASNRGLLSAIDFSNGSLVQMAGVEVEGAPQSATRIGDYFYLLTRDQLTSFKMDNGQLSELDRLELGQEPSYVMATSPETLLLLGEQSATLVNVNDPQALSLGATLGGSAQNAVMTQHGLLAWGSTANGDTTFSLFNVDDASDPKLLAELVDGHSVLEFERPYNAVFESNQLRPWFFDETSSRLFLPTKPIEGTTTILGLALSDGGIVLENEQPFEHCSYRPRAADDRLVCSDSLGIEQAAYEVGATLDEPASSYVSFFQAKPLASLTTSDFGISLWSEPDYGPYYLNFESGEEMKRVELTHRARTLVEYEGHLVAFALASSNMECEYSDSGSEGGADLAEGPCGTTQEAGLSVISLTDDDPAVVSTLPIVFRPDGDENFDSRSDWLGYAQLPDGRLAFFVNYIQRCNSRAECEELGVTAYRGMGSSGCSMDDAMGEGCNNDVIVTYSGHKDTFQIYVLEGVESGEPELALASSVDGRFELFGSGQDPDVGAQLLVKGKDFAVSRSESIYNDEGNSVTDKDGNALVRNYLHRFELGEEGELLALPPINTPGRVLTWSNDAALSVEAVPVSEGEVSSQVHLLRLEGDAAFIKRTNTVDYSYADKLTAGDVSYVLFGPKNWCATAPSSLLAPYSLKDGDWEEGEALALPGRYGFGPFPQPDADDELILYGGPVSGARLVLNTADPLQPKVERYTTEE